MAIPMKAVAIRPYASEIRQHVFKALSVAGIEVDAPENLRTANNDEVIRILQGLRADVLLTPFNVVRTENQERTNGLELLWLLREHVAWTRVVPAVMPVSVFARAAFEGGFAKQKVENLFPMFEDELQSPELPKRIAGFCRPFLGVKPTTF